tara:strand:+ start:1743 stop:2525 length:783 start_codon:yes stop_codon:yes gene_type:complete
MIPQQENNMSGGGGSNSPTYTTTINEPFAEQKSSLVEAFGMANAAFDAGADRYYPGSEVANQSFNTATAQQLGLDAAGVQGALGMGAANALNAAFDPLSAQSRAITDPFVAQLQGQILPGIGSQAIQQGAYGGDRQRIQEQSAVTATTDAATKAMLANQQNAMQNLAGVQSGLLRPASTVSEVGAQQERYQQDLINADINRFKFEQEAPQTSLDRLISRITGINLGNVSNTTSGGGQSSGVDLGGIAGLGLAGASLFGGK